MDSPGCVEALVRCGRLLLAAGDFRGALKDLTRAHALATHCRGRLSVTTTDIAQDLVRCCEELGLGPERDAWAAEVSRCTLAAACTSPDGTTWPACDQP